jgi:ketosteroid isomerase-like protein
MTRQRQPAFGHSAARTRRPARRCDNATRGIGTSRFLLWLPPPRSARIGRSRTQSGARHEPVGVVRLGTQIQNLERDGETRQFAAHGHAVIANAGGLCLMRGVFEPGWRWTVDVAPVAGTSTCQTHHLGYVLSGTMQIRMDDGEECSVTAGDIFDLPAGHDAWVVGNEPCVMVDYSSEATRYARGRTAGLAAPDDKYMTLVRRGFEAFNSGDMATLREILSHDVAQHVPGASQLAGAYKGIDSVLSYYGKLADLTDGTFRAQLIDVFGDGQGHVTAVYQTSGTRNGTTLVSRGSILFTFLGEKATDLLEMHADLPADDAFFA